MDNHDQSMAWLARRDGSVLLGYGPFESRATAPADGVAFYVQDFALSDRLPWKIPSRFVRFTGADFTMFFSESQPLNYHWQALDAAAFSLVFQEVMTAIHAGIFEKTVPVVTEMGQSSHSSGTAIITGMSRQHTPLQSYGWTQQNGGFAGATPELLFSLSGRHLETMALAGTARSEDQDVFAVDEKEIREHEYVAQTLVSKFQDLGIIHRDRRKILDLGSIVHFLTLIEVDLHASLTPDDLIYRLHPTPALGSLPRTDGTMEKLLEWRDRLGCPAEFGAPFGLWENGRFDSIVAIRGVWWDGSNLKIPAGCGVIEASRLVNEWRELRLKREAVKQFLV